MMSKKGHNVWHAYPCIIPGLYRLWYVDIKTDNRSAKVTGGQKKVKFVKRTQETYFAGIFI